MHGLQKTTSWYILKMQTKGGNKMSDESKDKTTQQFIKQRILYIFDQLNKGAILKKENLVTHFDVKGKTIQRDIQDLNDYYYLNYREDLDKLNEYNQEDKENKNISVAYDRCKGGYVSKLHLRLSNDEIFALVKMLIENRTFDKDETSVLCDHLLNMGTDDDQKLIRKLVGGEILNYKSYAENRNRQPLLSCVWKLAAHINNLDELEVVTRRQDHVVHKHIVYPVGITFSEYYFYLIVYYKDALEKGPRIFRIDRIEMVRPTGNNFDKKYIVQYKNEHFKEKLQFMYGGNDIHLQFRFWGDSIDAVMDRLPNAENRQLPDGSYLVRAHVYSKGIKMWLLSQMEFLEVIEPQSFREEMAQTIKKMASLYNKQGA